MSGRVVVRSPHSGADAPEELVELAEDAVIWASQHGLVSSAVDDKLLTLSRPTRWKRCSLFRIHTLVVVLTLLKSSTAGTMRLAAPKRLDKCSAGRRPA